MYYVCTMKTLSCSVARNNDLLRKEETIGQLINTNEAYAHICIRVRAFMHMRICVLGRRELRVYFGSDISELHSIYLRGMCDRSMRSGMQLAQEIQLTDWSTANAPV